jgi:hypothetical protein
MSFCRFFGIGAEVHPSRLAQSDFMKFVRNGAVAANDKMQICKETSGLAASAR